MRTEGYKLYATSKNEGIGAVLVKKTSLYISDCEENEAVCIECKLKARLRVRVVDTQVHSLQCFFERPWCPPYCASLATTILKSG
jgi:Holliday junction resolvase